MPRLLLNHATVLTMDHRFTLFPDGFVLIEDDTIRAVGPASALDAGSLPDAQILDCNGKIVLPGMVNTHCHAPMVVFRSLGDDVPDRLRRYMIPLENQIMNEEVVSAAAAYAMAELLLGGVTTVCDNYAYTQQSARVAARCGIRAVLGGPGQVMPSTAPDPALECKNLRYQQEFLQEWSNHPLVTPMLTCHAPYSESPQQLQACSRLAAEHGLLFTMHVSEMAYERDECQRKFGLSPIAYLEKLGVLTKQLLAAHVILADEADLQLLAANGVSVSHNIGSNLKSAKGVAPVARMRALGIPVGLGSDGAMSGNTLDLFTQLPLVAKLQKTATGDRSAFPAREVLSMATLEGARALGMDAHIGSLEPGKKADLIIVETDSVNMSPIFDFYSALVYSANPSNVESTIVNGQLVMHHRKLLTTDFPTVRQNALRFCTQIRTEADRIDGAMEGAPLNLAY